MKNEIEGAIKVLLAKITAQLVKGDDALKFTQAALNLAHTAQVLTQVKITEKQR